MKRHQMRESAFILVFEKIFVDEPVESILETAEECEEVKLNADAKALFTGVAEKTELLDEEIKKYLKNWTIERISKVSLAILRLAVYEILFSDETPTSVAIDEAVELAKEYSTGEDASFINGVLGSFARSLEAPAQ